MDVFALVLSLLILATPTEQAIKDLGHQNWRVREQAEFVIRCQADKLSMQKLQTAMCETKDLEVQHRAQRIIAWYEWKSQPPYQPTPWEVMRAIRGQFFWP